MRIYYPTDCEPNKTLWKPDSYASSLGRYATDKLPRFFGFLSSFFLANISVPQYEAKTSSDVEISKTSKKKETVIFSATVKYQSVRNNPLAKAQVGATHNLKPQRQPEATTWSCRTF